MGSEVHICGPATLIPSGITQLGASIAPTVEDAVANADVVMALRIQKERQVDPLLPSLREYSAFFGINKRLLKLAKPDAIIMHPGPINRGVDMTFDVADGEAYNSV